MATGWLSWKVVWGGTWVWAWPLCASFTHLQIGVSVAPASFFRPNESVYNVLPHRASTRKGMLAFVVTVVGFSLPFTPVSSLGHRQCLTHGQCLKHKRLSVTAGGAAMLPPHRVTWHLSPALLAHHCVPSCWDTRAGTEVGGKRCSFLREGSERVRAGLLLKAVNGGSLIRWLSLHTCRVRLSARAGTHQDSWPHPGVRANSKCHETSLASQPGLYGFLQKSLAHQ